MKSAGFVVFLCVVAFAFGLSACVENTKAYSDRVIESNKAITQKYVTVDEHLLPDGTRCAVATTGNTNGGASITCDWN